MTMINEHKAKYIMVAVEAKSFDFICLRWLSKLVTKLTSSIASLTWILTVIFPSNALEDYNPIFSGDRRGPTYGHRVIVNVQ